MPPNHPKINFRKLPFYEVKGTLLRPSPLQAKGTARFQEQNFTLRLSKEQASTIEKSIFKDTAGQVDYKKQIQLRFSYFDTTTEQVDCFPPSVCVKVNGKLQTLPKPVHSKVQGEEPKRPSIPLNITQLVNLQPNGTNQINVSWTVEYGSEHIVSAFYVEKLNSQDLLKKLVSKGQRPPDCTRDEIKNKLNDPDNDVATEHLKLTLLCPLGMIRMKMPCRSTKCDHFQCFDANFFLMMNERKDTWICPVCNSYAPFDTLMLDGYFIDILSSKELPKDEQEINIHNDGSWTTKVPEPLLIPDCPNENGEFDDVDDGDDPKDDHNNNSVDKKKGDDSFDCVTLDSEDDDDEQGESVPNNDSQSLTTSTNDNESPSKAESNQKRNRSTEESHVTNSRTSHEKNKKFKEQIDVNLSNLVYEKRRRPPKIYNDDIYDELKNLPYNTNKSPAKENDNETYANDSSDNELDQNWEEIHNLVSQEDGNKSDDEDRGSETINILSDVEEEDVDGIISNFNGDREKTWEEIAMETNMLNDLPLEDEEEVRKREMARIEEIPLW